MKHLISIMAVFLLMGCNATNNIPKQTAPDNKVNAVHLIKDEDKEPISPKTPDKFSFVTVPKAISCAPNNKILKKLMEVEEKPIALWKDAFQGHQVMVFTNQKTGTTTILEYPPLFEGDYACLLSIGVETILLHKPETQGIKIKYLTN